MRNMWRMDVAMIHLSTLKDSAAAARPTLRAAAQVSRQCRTVAFIEAGICGDISRVRRREDASLSKILLLLVLPQSAAIMLFTAALC